MLKSNAVFFKMGAIAPKEAILMAKGALVVKTTQTGRK